MNLFLSKAYDGLYSTASMFLISVPIENSDLTPEEFKVFLDLKNRVDYIDYLKETNSPTSFEDWLKKEEENV
jgi:hypothetical protein